MSLGPPSYLTLSILTLYNLMSRYISRDPYRGFEKEMTWRLDCCSFDWCSED
jgi:hypothetical protein